MIYIADIVLGAFFLGPIANFLVARWDMPSGIPVSMLRRAAWVTLIAYSFFAVFYWFTWRPISSLMHTGAIHNIDQMNVEALFLGFFALFVALSVFNWGVWACPTMLMGYAYLRVSRGQTWCVEKVRQETDAWNTSPWTRRFVYGTMIVAQSWVVICIIWILADRAALGI